MKVKDMFVLDEDGLIEDVKERWSELYDAINSISKVIGDMGGWSIGDDLDEDLLEWLKVDCENFKESEEDRECFKDEILVYEKYIDMLEK